MLRRLGRAALAATTSALRLLRPAVAGLWRLVKPVLLRVPRVPARPRHRVRGVGLAATRRPARPARALAPLGGGGVADHAAAALCGARRVRAAVDAAAAAQAPFAVVLIAKGQIVLAGILFAFAKVVATALVARLFMLTQQALMQIGWFAWGYETSDAVEGRARCARARVMDLARRPRRSRSEVKRTTASAVAAHDDRPCSSCVPQCFAAAERMRAARGSDAARPQGALGNAAAGLTLTACGDLRYPTALSARRAARQGAGRDIPERERRP